MLASQLTWTNLTGVLRDYSCSIHGVTINILTLAASLFDSKTVMNIHCYYWLASNMN